MKTAFIACEYNPFHSGHRYHIQSTKNNFADAVICIMSGNFVQRGDIAVANKFIRAKTALLNGADLVIELPVKYATADASHFAEGFIRTIKATGLDGLISFGAENNLEALISTSELIFSDEAEKFADDKQKAGINYATAKSLFLKQHIDNADEILGDANNILALEYIKNAYRILDKPEFFCVRRNGSSHDSLIPENGFASAGYLRRMIDSDSSSEKHPNFLEGWKYYIPDNAYELYCELLQSGLFPADRDKFDIAVFSRLLTLDSTYFSDVNNVNAGLENRIVSCLRSSNSLTDLYDFIKTKRFTHSRIRQIILQAALGITREDISAGVSYVRILGFNSIGRELLAEMRKTAEKPLITNLSDASKCGDNAIRDSQIDYIAGKLFNICCPVPTKGNPEFNYHPVIID